ncbi:MAG: sortase [Clostridiales bacterium]|nr:sortase [Clostridiales bacterium]
MRKTGIALIVLGTLLMAGALFLFLQNKDESKDVAEVCDVVTQEIKDKIKTVIDQPITVPTPTEHVNPYNEEQVLRSYEMRVVDIDGNGYIGYISIPSIEVELPVISEYSYPKLRIAPCRMLGSTKSGDLIICGHNIESIFGRLGELTPGDVAYFTDMDGETRRYIVTGTEVIGLTDAAALKSGEWDMTVFTCTYGGGRRIVVRFVEVPDGYEISNR